MIFSVRAYSASFFLLSFVCFFSFVRLCVSFSRCRLSTTTAAAFGLPIVSQIRNARATSKFHCYRFDFANSFTKRPAKKGTLSLCCRSVRIRVGCSKLLLFECGHGGMTYFAFRSFVLNHEHSIQLCKYFTVFFFFRISLSLSPTAARTVLSLTTSPRTS